MTAERVPTPEKAGAGRVGISLRPSRLVGRFSRVILVEQVMRTKLTPLRVTASVALLRPPTLAGLAVAIPLGRRRPVTEAPLETSSATGECARKTTAITGPVTVAPEARAAIKLACPGRRA